MQTLNVSGNQINGTLPSCMGNMTFMKTIDVRCNELIGNVPKSMANLLYLETFYLSCNNVSCDFSLPGVDVKCQEVDCSFCLQLAAPCPMNEYMASCGRYRRDTECPARVGEVC